MVDAGVKGFKCFLVHSGVDEFPSVTESDVRLAMKQMQGTDAVFLVCHEMSYVMYITSPLLRFAHLHDTCSSQAVKE